MEAMKWWWQDPIFFQNPKLYFLKKDKVNTIFFLKNKTKHTTWDWFLGSKDVFKKEKKKLSHK